YHRSFRCFSNKLESAVPTHPNSKQVLKRVRPSHRLMAPNRMPVPHTKVLEFVQVHRHLREAPAQTAQVTQRPFHPAQAKARPWLPSSQPCAVHDALHHTATTTDQ